MRSTLIATTALVADGASKKDAAALALRESKLGNPFRIHSGVTEFRKAVGEAFTEHNAALGLPSHASVDDDVRAQIRTRIAREMFETELGRAPLDDRELSGWVAKNSRAKTTAVAGYDVTFSPVKSVSALWALAPREMSEAIEAAHHDAVEDALDWFENNALLTRLGTDGVQQVDTEGMLAAAFTHRDSRAGEPDLHTHVAISTQHSVHDAAAPENCGATDIGGTFGLETFKTGGVMRPRGKRLRTYYQNRRGYSN